MPLWYCEQALPILQEIGNPYEEAATWDSIGYAHHNLGSHEPAIGCYQRALDMYRQLGGGRYDEADVLSHIGDVHHSAGRSEAASTAWQDAVTILDELGHPDADKLRVKLGILTDPD